MIRRFFASSFTLVLWALQIESAPSDNAPETVTFNQHIAPIILEHCTPCHREGMSAPFQLLTYEDTRRRAKQIKEVTESKYMPPWLPEPVDGGFKHERGLSDQQIRLIKSWFDTGSKEGDDFVPPSIPDWPGDWQLGEPDLIASMPNDYSLQAEGRDIYRNFVLKVPITKPLYVKELEFHPENARVVHHALIYIDSTRQSQRRDNADPKPGFGGMRVPMSAGMPEGQFLSWQPGKIYSKSDNSIPWMLQPGTDLVIQVHMNPTGKVEDFSCSVGLHFTETPPSSIPYKIKLTSLAIDIPSETSFYRVKDSMQLPVDVQLTRILPHAHYLCKRMEGYAILPEGIKKRLILIKNWDFNWQGDYIYETPIKLPKGTVLHMDYTYDNSTGNLANPHSPPKKVTYGPESSDEMAELWFQFILNSLEDRKNFKEKVRLKNKQVLIQFGQSTLGSETNDPDLLLITAQAHLATGDQQAAFRAFSRVVRLDPKRFNAWFNIGTMLRSSGQDDAAKQAFGNVIRIDPNDAEAYGSLGIIFQEEGKLEPAEKCFRAALRLNPTDQIAANALLQILEKRRNQVNEP
ncbi:MAG: tetratricopeptide repeat protein [Verrucomicrobia bacterium]|nr:tetratricopeptide repeat protein [Verrucomicrobiota bacterium]